MSNKMDYDLCFDRNEMMAAADRAEQEMIRIRAELELLEESVSGCRNKTALRGDLKRLGEICKGYENLIIYMRGASNIYGAAETFAVRNIDF